MREFNVKEYDNDKSLEVCTRNRRKVRILATHSRDSESPIVAAITDYDGSEYMMTFADNGKHTNIQDTPFDLFFKK